MKFKIQIVIDDENQTQIEDVISLEGHCENGYSAGLSMQQAKEVLSTLQKTIVLRQAKSYTDSHRSCDCCSKQRRIKGYHYIQYKTLFGTIVIPSLRLYHCKCSNEEIKTLSVLRKWLPEHISPELQYIETKWASCMSFNKTSEFLSDILPISHTHNGVTVRRHLHKVAKRQESELDGQPRFISGCANDWAKLPKPDKPITIGIDGGYVRSSANKRTNFEVIIGKSFSKSKPAKRFGLFQSIDKHPHGRLLHTLRSQGMQENQQITFLSDGADNVRDLQYIMHPESEHILDWFHLTMRITVLNQFAKGFIKSDIQQGEDVKKHLKSTKWFLWHGNIKEALDRIEECYLICMDEDIKYRNRKKLIKHLGELSTYVENNRHMIPNYGERWRYGETIASSFVESTVNEVVTKRMVKKQQMQWSDIGAHLLIQTRTATLNGDLPDYFERWYPGLNIGGNDNSVALKKAA